ncbi:lysine-rich nucleolar protein 1 [Bufo gargarizans]|uniref:lysine-rich nucleolar protein 1 n=1 Tax=Bufo gargarizans TaxID=30331 RepID=UPI001CF45205|nr:lysine-rich nucleolar protein 1 [Bufo gargarizans]
MTGSDEESTTFNKPTERKKKKQKKQKNEDSEKSESQGHNNENTMMKKKQKKKAEATGDVPEIMDVVSKKKNKIKSSDPNKNDDFPKKKMGDPTSAERTHKKKKKKNVLAQESSTCDLQMNEDVPKKNKKKNNIEDAGSLELESIDPGHKNDESAAVEDSKEIVTEKKKKRKKSKPAENKSEDGAPGTEDVLIDVSDIKKKKRKEASELEEKSGSPTEDQPETSEHAMVKKKKKKKKKATSVKTEEVIEDHDVHHGENGGGSQRVSKIKKKSKGSNIEHRESDLKRNGDEDSDVPTEGGLKKKRGNRAEKTTELVDGTEKSCEKEKFTNKRKKMQKHNDESHCANEDTTEVPKKKKKKETKNSKGANKKQEESTDVQLVSARDGNADEAHGGPVKRKASTDTDRESGNTKGTKFGQWDTAAFQNPEQQSKFFRLLGGFKKGNQETSNQVKANMALEKEGEQALERNLLAEFDKAVSWKRNRGIGLGFQPAPNKFFYIDKTRSTSVKFDD